MDVANELFCNGKVVPLQPPPRLHYVMNQSSSVSSHSTPNSVRKGSSRRWNFSMSNDDDFDPFMVALEVVRNEFRGREPNTSHRRSRSFSPTRSHLIWPSPKRPVRKAQHAEQTGPIGKTILPNPVSHTKPTMTTLLEHEPEPDSEGALKRKGSDRKVSKRLNDVKKIVFRTDTDRARCDDKLLPQMDPIKEPLTITNQKAHYNKQRQLANQELRKRTPNKAPCFLVCLGFGKNGSRDLN
ncbi:hypothetical protein ACHQM5_012887 [Ranunculus cassubicifolius]